MVLKGFQGHKWSLCLLESGLKRLPKDYDAPWIHFGIFAFWATGGEMFYATGGGLGNPNHWFPGPGLSYLSKYPIAGYNFEPPEANGLCPASPVYPKQPNRPAYSTQPANRPINILCYYFTELICLFIYIWRNQGWQNPFVYWYVYPILFINLLSTLLPLSVLLCP